MVVPLFLKRKVSIIKKIFNTTVSVKEGASRNVLRGIIQYDTLNEVNIRLSDGSKAFDYTGYTNIVFKVLKADGTSYIDSEGENVIATSPIDGIITVNLAGQATTSVGLCQSVIEVYSGEDKMTTARFNYEVFETLDTDHAVESTTEYPALQNMLADLSTIKAEASEASGYATRAEVAAETAEMWAKASQNVAEGDFATRAELEAVETGAAPAGYGLGVDRIPKINHAELDNTKRAGWYIFYDTTNPVEGVAAGFVECRGFHSSITDSCIQEFYAVSGLYPMLKRYIVPEGWSAWEWVNPPMELGVEYRTTERYRKKPVYVKLLNFGALPDNTTKTVLHEIANVEYMICVTATAKGGSGSLTVNNMRGVEGCYATNENIVIETSGNLSTWPYCFCVLKYTKTNDT